MPGLASVFAATLSVKATLFLLEVRNKRSVLSETWRGMGPEATSSVVHRSVFWWLNSLLLKGFKSSLTTEDLFEIDNELRSAPRLQNLLVSWNKFATSKYLKHRLILALCHSLWPAMLASVLPRLFLMAFKFAQPFLIKRVIGFVQRTTGETGQDRINIGYSLIAATGLIFVGLAVSKSCMITHSRRVGC